MVKIKIRDFDMTKRDSFNLFGKDKKEIKGNQRNILLDVIIKFKFKNKKSQHPSTEFGFHPNRENLEHWMRLSRIFQFFFKKM